MSFLFQSLGLLASEAKEEFSGLNPKAFILLGAGFSKEAVKSELLALDISLTRTCVMTLGDCLTWLGEIEPEALVQDPLLLEDFVTLIMRRCRLPLLGPLRKIPGGLQEIVRALEKGPLAFAHEEECLAMESCLEQDRSRSQMREELKSLRVAWESFLEAQGRYDFLSLMRYVTSRLQESWPESCVKMDRFYDLSFPSGEGAQAAFYDALSRHIKQCPMIAPLNKDSKPQIERHFVHSSFDALEWVSQDLAQGWSPNQAACNSVFIPDDLILRRALNEALSRHGVWQNETRDPTELKLSEELKIFLIPISLVAQGYPILELRTFLLSWGTWILRSKEVPGQELDLVLFHLEARGWKSGSLFGLLKEIKAPEVLETWLKNFDQSFTKRLPLTSWIKKCLDLFQEASDLFALPIPESLVLALEALQKRHEQLSADSKFPCGILFRLIQKQLAQQAPQAQFLNPEWGLGVFRFGQSPPLGDETQVQVLGMNLSWLSSANVGDLWWSAAERERLSFDFCIQSARTQMLSKALQLDAWAQASKKMSFWEADWDLEAKPCESLDLFFKCWEKLSSLDLNCFKKISKKDHSPYPLWNSSYGPAPAQAVSVHQLSRPLDQKLSVTQLDTLNRCSFLFLAQERWGLRPLQRQGLELWPQVRGKILHRALFLALDSGLSLDVALDKAWSQEPNQGISKIPILQICAKQQCLKILSVWEQVEQQYLQASKARPLYLEGPRLSRDFPLPEGGFLKLEGRPDRVDQLEEGVMILDYKSGRVQLHGQDLIEEGLGLQLGFYALCLSQDAPILGLQWVPLSLDGSRSRGLYFSKNLQKWMKIRPSSLSLIQLEPKEAMHTVHYHLQNSVTKWGSAEFEAKPHKKFEKNCDTCSYSLLCHHSRRARK